MVTRKMLHPATALAHAAEGRDFVMHARIAVRRNETTVLVQSILRERSKK
jgi:hypothetical protein